VPKVITRTLVVFPPAATVKVIVRAAMMRMARAPARDPQG
jgi:hypothetical protein